MSWLLRITFILALFSILTLYGWMLKNKPERQESNVFKDLETLPDLTFSRLADFEQKLITELDIIPIEDLEKFQKEEMGKFENVHYDLDSRAKEKTEKTEKKEANNTIEVIVMICVSVFGITVVLCLVRNFYARQDYETDLEQAPIIEVSNQESENSYQVEKF